MSRKSNPQKLRNETNYQGAFLSYPTTAEEQELQEWRPSDTLLSAGTKAAYDRSRRDIIEGAGGHSGVVNPYAAARMRQIGLEELAADESSALADADERYNNLILQNKQFLASLRRPQYITQRTSGYGEQFPPGGGGGTLEGIGSIASSAGIMAAAL